MPENRILHRLRPDEFSTLLPRLTPIVLRQNDVLYGAGARIGQVYFPLRGLISLLKISENGDAIETGSIGAEGLVGGLTLLNVDRSTSHTVVQISGRALKLSTESFLEACAAIPNLRCLVQLHIHTLLYQAHQNAACHALHTVESRLCRWLLQAQDMTKSDVLDLTQEFLSNMLGAQRTSISMIAHALQQAGFIRYRRGRIEIVDRLGLETAACDCYSLIKNEIDTHLPQQAPGVRRAGAIDQAGSGRADPKTLPVEQAVGGGADR
jgi:CRP-like cAMP-binding protein